MASRTPISRVRSVTLTSMMFMMPMPPTSRLTAATAPSSEVISWVVPDRVSASCRVSRTLKLSSSAGPSLRRSRSSWRRPDCTLAVSTPSCTETSRVLMFRLPVTRRCSVCSGMSTVSSWSLPIAAWPLEASRPMTVHENCLMRRLWPSGSTVAPNSSRRTVVPMTQTAAPERSSVSSKLRPAARVQLPVWK